MHPMNTRKKQIILRGATLLSILILTCPGSVMSQSKAPKLPASKPVKTPEVVVEFLKVSGPEPESEVFYARAKEALWSVYPHDETLKRELVAYVQSATDGPGLGFAGLALIPFHDPTTVKPLMNRALDRRSSPATRSCFLNAAPYVLSMGDAFFQGQGALDREAQDFAREILKLAGAASLNGLGRSH